MDTEYSYLLDLVGKRLVGVNIKNQEAVAKAVYQACRDYCDNVGMKADIETDFREPGAQRHIPASNGWTVVFEAGPYDWAISLSFYLLERGCGLCEPYYGFDLTFYRED